MVNGRELNRVEKHLIWCHACVHRASIAQDFIDAMRAAIIQGNFDLDCLEQDAAKKSKRSR